MMFESAELEASDTRTPRNSEIHWNADDCEPGTYGKAPMKGHGQDQRPNQLVSGFGPVVREGGEADMADLNLLEDGANQPQDQDGRQGDHGEVEQIGHDAQEAEPERPDWCR